MHLLYVRTHKCVCMCAHVCARTHTAYEKVRGQLSLAASICTHCAILTAQGFKHSITGLITLAKNTVFKIVTLGYNYNIPKGDLQVLCNYDDIWSFWWQGNLCVSRNIHKASVSREVEERSELLLK